MEGYTENIIPQELPPEEIINDGLGLLVRRKRLYHGSGTKGISRLNSAEETTVGDGIYFTSESDKALGYAERRSRTKKDGEPVVYWTEIENMKFLDLRNPSNVFKILDDFKSVLIETKKQKNWPWNYEAVLENAIKAISNHEVKNLKQITFSLGDVFTGFVKSLGYDGLITIEGGEGEDVGEHDTYLVFDPGKVSELTVEQ